MSEAIRGTCRLCSADAPSEARERFLGFWEGALTPAEAIEARHAVRRYSDEPLDAPIVEALGHAIGVVNEEAGLSIQLALDEPRAFAGFKGRMAGFSGVRNYLVLVGPEWKWLDRVLGYYGEKLVLFAQSLGLNSCWVGSTYKMVPHAYGVDLGQKLSAVIALGYGLDAGMPHDSKPPQDASPDYDSAPSWFQRGVEAALLAPTALNQQRFSFSLAGEEDGMVLVRAVTKHGRFAKMDLGIAQCHFEIGAGNAPFVWSEC